MLVKAGMRTVQMIGVPHQPIGDAGKDLDAVVIALKSRTTPAADAVEESLAALRWLRDAGCRQFYFKYCSTFDSTERGNIGPVAEALMAEQGSSFAVACPAFPANQRTIYKGDLSVTLRDNFAGVGHIQIASVPERHEPDEGEVNYPHLFRLLDELGYDGWEGGEYRPRGKTEDGLGWLKSLS